MQIVIVIFNVVKCANLSAIYKTHKKQTEKEAGTKASFKPLTQTEIGEASLRSSRPLLLE